MLEISIAKSFSLTPGPRYREEGPFSGEQFREEVLLPAFDKAVSEREKLTINLDGTAGYGTSFLEEVFGGLARIREEASVIQTLEIISTEEPYLLNDIAGYIREANKLPE